ncbi:COP9 signalosome complex subunit 8-like [Gigantopelta aegis]|uniref:COP9 signalosome complex subunit 8-like n=1 Tax=Gigantopelta aegis TaxID=1735272 RepID=UPI001B88C95D|nr:COP9 signalosome complex subunit 8-like [Gigantopelta aegis]
MALEEHVNFVHLLNDLENQELEAPSGVATAQVYGQLLTLYLLFNDTCNAKLVWKRTPAQLKSSNPELALIWAIGQKMIQREYPAVYDTIKKEWPDYLKPFMTAMLETTRKRAFDLIGLAYASINVDVLAPFVGLPASEAVQTAVSKGWKIDAKSQVVTPKKPDPPPSPPMISEHQLAVLTDYVSFLEN